MKTMDWANENFRVLVAALNRVYEESAEKNTDGSKKVRTVLLKRIGANYNSPSLFNSALRLLENDGYIKVIHDPLSTDEVYCANAYSMLRIPSQN